MSESGGWVFTAAVCSEYLQRWISSSVNSDFASFNFGSYPIAADGSAFKMDECCVLASGA